MQIFLWESVVFLFSILYMQCLKIFSITFCRQCEEKRKGHGCAGYFSIAYNSEQSGPWVAYLGAGYSQPSSDHFNSVVFWAPNTLFVIMNSQWIMNPRVRCRTRQFLDSDTDFYSQVVHVIITHNQFHCHKCGLLGSSLCKELPWPDPSH